MGIVVMRNLSEGCEFASGTRIGGLKGESNGGLKNIGYVNYIAKINVYTNEDPFFLWNTYHFLTPGACIFHSHLRGLDGSVQIFTLCKLEQIVCKSGLPLNENLNIDFWMSNSFNRVGC